MTDVTQRNSNTLVRTRFFTIRRIRAGAEPDSDEYNPYAERQVEHPVSDFYTLVHLLKGTLDSGILAMPHAFRNVGLWLGLFFTFFVGFICSYCVHILIRCSQILCKRRRIPQLSFAEVAQHSFLDGPEYLHQYANFFHFVVNSFLVVNLLGCCCIYFVFVSVNIDQLTSHYVNHNITVRLWIVIFTIPMIFMCLVRNLKYIIPFSIVANLCILIGAIITFVFLLHDIPNVSEREGIVEMDKWPMFFGTVTFAVESIGIAMPLENEMRNPKRIIGCPSVLCLGTIVVLALNSSLGFFGFLKYGHDVAASITLNLPVMNFWARAVKLMMAAAMFFTFTVQFYVPVNIIWEALKDKIPDETKRLWQYCLRISLVLLCSIVAIALPNLGPFISMIGAVCLGFLGMIIPAVIELAVYQVDPGYGFCLWRLWKNIGIIIFGIIGTISGTYVSVKEMIETYE